jgi:hypothetical protein
MGASGCRTAPTAKAMQKFYEEQVAAIREATTSPRSRQGAVERIGKLLQEIREKASSGFPFPRNNHHIHLFPETLRRIQRSPPSLMDDVIAFGNDAWACVFTQYQTQLMADMFFMKYTTPFLLVDPTPEQVAKRDYQVALKTDRIARYLADAASKAVVSRATEWSAADKALAQATATHSTAKEAMAASVHFHATKTNEESVKAAELAAAKTRFEETQREAAAKRPGDDDAAGEAAAKRSRCA